MPRQAWDRVCSTRTQFTLQRVATTNLLGECLPVPVDLLDRHAAHDGPLVALHSLQADQQDLVCLELLE